MNSPTYEWKTIESAPEETEILVFVPGIGGGVCAAEHDHGEWYALHLNHIVYDGQESLYTLDAKPTHWMPLPEPPSASLTKDKTP
jgi:hypothetical protein